MSSISHRCSKRRRSQPSQVISNITSFGEQHQLQRAIASSRLDAQSAPLCVPAGPTFYPTVEEFEGNPLTYISKIRSQAEPYGICKIVPPEGWKPPFCVDMESDKLFETKEQKLHRLQEGISFGDGEEYTPASYEIYAAEVSAKWKEAHYASGNENDSKRCTRRNPRRNEPMTLESLEQDYWRVVETQQYSMAVDYGNDIDTHKYWSGFPLSRRGRALNGALNSVDQTGDNEKISPPFGTAEFYHESYWNLNNISCAPGSILGHVKVGINGINVPWLYFGTLFTTFCWHNEDNYLYSINYHHKGAPKLWYGVPGNKKDADAMELVFKNYLAMKLREVPDLLHHITTMISPRILQQNGVPVFKILQYPGEYIVTFPRSFHCGFSLGPNVGEAVNFATPDWISFGGDASERYRSISRPSVFSHDRLIFTIATHVKTLDITCCDLLLNELHRIVDEEIRCRSNLLKVGVRDVSRDIELPKNRCDQVDEASANYDDKRLCRTCKHVCFFSAVACECSSTRVSCLRHSQSLCKCPSHKKYLMIWTSKEEMKTTISLVEAHRKELEATSALQTKPLESLSSTPVIASGAIRDWHRHKNVMFRELGP